MVKKYKKNKTKSSEVKVEKNIRKILVKKFTSEK